MTTPYHSGYWPPFPTLPIVLQVEDLRLGPFTALLDTGADITLITTDLLEQVGAAESGPAKVRSHFGERLPAQLYLVGIQVQKIVLPGVYVIGDDVGKEMLLGRDVLNKLALFLDGPAQQTDVLDDATVNRLRARRG